MSIFGGSRLGIDWEQRLRARDADRDKLTSAAVTEAQARSRTADASFKSAGADVTHADVAKGLLPSQIAGNEASAASLQEQTKYFGQTAQANNRLTNARAGLGELDLRSGGAPATSAQMLGTLGLLGYSVAPFSAAPTRNFDPPSTTTPRQQDKLGLDKYLRTILLDFDAL